MSTNPSTPMNTNRIITVGPGLAAHVREPQHNDTDSVETILWIHGYTMDGSVWNELWSRLPNYRHVGLDLPGHGQSAPIPPDITLPDVGRAIARVAYEQGARKLVAISFGGMMALQAAIEAPEQFDAIVLGSPALGGGPQDVVAGRKHLELMLTYAVRGSGPWMTKLWMQWPPDIFKGASEHSALWLTLEHIIARHAWSELKHRALHLMAQHAQTAKMLQGIRANVLLVLGEHDMPIFVEIAARLSAMLPHSHLHTVATAGHLALLEAPEDASAMIEAHMRAERLQGEILLT